MVKVLIVDNEVEIRNGLQELIKLYCPQINEIQQAEGVVSGVKAIYEFKPDLVFTDVEMDDGTGMDLLSRIPDINFQVVFITAHNKYAVNAFKYSAIDFLLKPIDVDDLVQAVHKAIEGIKTKTLVKQLSVFKENTSSTEKKIVLKDSESIYVVKVADIIHCQSEGTYTTFYISPSEKIVISKTIKEYEELLEQYGFLRTHQSHLVNTSKIKRFDKQDGGFLIMENGDSIPVSQRKKESVLNAIQNI